MSLRAPALLRTSQLHRAYVCSQCRLALLRQQRRNISETHKQKVRDAEGQWHERAKEIRAGKRKSMVEILEARGLIHDIVGERKDLDWLLTEKRAGVYCGIDPTAPSLHVGHLVCFMTLFWMYVHGYHAVTLVGGGTARVGDPTGRTTDRPQMTSTERKANIVSMHYQLKKIWDNVEKVAQKYGYRWEKYWHRELVNNAVWWNKVPFVDVLKYMGSGMRLGPMLSRETVKKKMDSGDGMSLAEFCYPAMQAWDWWYMYDTKRIQIQIGGSDQYGNIVAGADAVKHTIKTHPEQKYSHDNVNMPTGFTAPLLTTASGDKFGKSAGNAIWLDQNMTSLFDLYAFLVGTADADVERYLKMFTFMPLKDIEDLMRIHNEDRSKRRAQHTLADEFIQLVHGKANADKARGQYEQRSQQRRFTSLSSLMSTTEATPPSDGEIPQPTTQTAPQQPSEDEPVPPSPFIQPLKLDAKNPLAHNQNPSTRERAKYPNPRLNPFAPPTDPNKPAQGAMRVTLPVSLIKGQPIARVLHSAGLVTSRSEGHRITSTGGAYIGRRSSDREQMYDDLMFVPAKLSDASLTWRNVIRDHEGGAMDKKGEEGVLVLRVGKWKVRIVRIVSDELFETLNVPDPPGWTEMKSVQAAEKAKVTSKADTEDDKFATSDDTQFIEPARKLSRSDVEYSRREGRRAASAYFDNESVRQQLSRHWMGKEDPSPKRREPPANVVSLGAEEKEEEEVNRGHESRPRHASEHALSLYRSPRDDRDMTEKRLARLKHAKLRMLRRGHEEGSAKVTQMIRREMKSQRDAESAEMDRIREQGRDDKPKQLGHAKSGRAKISSGLTSKSGRHGAPLTTSVDDEDPKARELRAVRERRRRERERLIGGMIDQGWWKGETLQSKHDGAA